MAEITINQEYIVKLNATIETDLTDEEIKNLIPTLPEVLKELITEEITGGVGTVDVEPVKYGYWKHVAGMNSKCSECDRYFPVSEFGKRPFDINYCPNCGAKMDGKEVQE